MCRPPRIAGNADERTARRSMPATIAGCVFAARLKAWEGHKPGSVRFRAAIIYLAPRLP